MFLFENTMLAALLGFLVVSLLLIRRLITGEPVPRKTLGITTIITISLAAASWAIVTPQERIIAICRDLARFVDEGNVTEIGRRLALDFTTNGMNREEFLDRLDAALTRSHLDQVWLRNINVEMENDARAVVSIGVTCNVRTPEGFVASLPSRWRLRFSKPGEQWLLKEVESIPIPPLHLKNPLPLNP